MPAKKEAAKKEPKAAKKAPKTVVPEESVLVDVVLKKPLFHNGRERKAGDMVSVSRSRADWLIKLGVV